MRSNLITASSDGSVRRAAPSNQIPMEIKVECRAFENRSCKAAGMPATMSVSEETSNEER